MTHICVSKVPIIGSDNGSSPGRCQAITWTNAGIFLIGHLKINLSEILMGIYIFSFKKMHWKMSSGKCRPYCFGLNVIIKWPQMKLKLWWLIHSCLECEDWWHMWYFFMNSKCSDLLALRWRHNDHAGVSNHQPPGCLLNRLFRRKSKKTSKLRVTGLCAGNSPGTGEFSAQMASYAENVSIWWRHHGIFCLLWWPCFMQYRIMTDRAITELDVIIW